MTEDLTSKCPLCKQPSPKVKDLFLHPDRLSIDHEIGFLFDCRSCGRFMVAIFDLRHTLLKLDVQTVASPVLVSEIEAFRLSALLREHRIKGRPTVWLRFRDDDAYGMLVDKDNNESPSHVKMPVSELLSRWPDTVPEKLNRTLQNLANLSRNGGQRVELPLLDRGVCFASNWEEMIYQLDSLCDQELLHEPRHSLSEGSEAVVSAEGWSRVDELARGPGSPVNKALVAMWFGDDDHKSEMTALYEKVIEPAVEDAGYRATRVDREQHNDYIMDEVMGLIRLAPFVIADFTDNRRGVYFEAGFARGLGLQVIHTCRKSDFDKHAHFDIKQVNTITWEQPEDLSKPLCDRIMGTIGKGPYKKRET